jgi:hypothetical protein
MGPASRLSGFPEGGAPLAPHGEPLLHVTRGWFGLPLHAGNVSHVLCVLHRNAWFFLSARRGITVQAALRVTLVLVVSWVAVAGSGV